jgi:hypothetical protein
LQQWHTSYEAMQAAVARVLDHLEDYPQELTVLMTERFHLVPERKAEAVPCGAVEAERDAAVDRAG